MTLHSTRGNRMRAAIVPMVLALTLGGCTAMQQYTLVPAGTAVSVSHGTMTVQPPRAWNKVPKGSLGVPQEESWTQNGPVLDGIIFIGALPDGQSIAKQRPEDERKVPAFHATMTPQDLVSMVESAYRIKTGARIFDTVSVKPVTFVGEHGVQFDYTYMRDDNLKRRGRCLMAVAGGKLYLMSLDATALHYFDADLPDFEAMAASASIRKG